MLGCITLGRSTSTAATQDNGLLVWLLDPSYPNYSNSNFDDLCTNAQR